MYKEQHLISSDTIRTHSNSNRAINSQLIDTKHPYVYIHTLSTSVFVSEAQIEKNIFFCAFQFERKKAKSKSVEYIKLYGRTDTHLNINNIIIGVN